MCVSVFEERQVGGQSMRGHSKQKNSICKGLKKRYHKDSQSLMVLTIPVSTFRAIRSHWGDEEKGHSPCLLELRVWWEELKQIIKFNRGYKRLSLEFWVAKMGTLSSTWESWKDSLRNILPKLRFEEWVKFSREKKMDRYSKQRSNLYEEIKM